MNGGGGGNGGKGIRMRLPAPARSAEVTESRRNNVVVGEQRASAAAVGGGDMVAGGKERDKDNRTASATNRCAVPSGTSWYRIQACTGANRRPWLPHGCLCRPMHHGLVNAGHMHCDGRWKPMASHGHIAMVTSATVHSQRPQGEQDIGRKVPRRQTSAC